MPNQPIRIHDAPPAEPDERTREVWVQRRRALLIELTAIEDYLGLQRTWTPRRKRNETMIEKFDRITGTDSC